MGAPPTALPVACVLLCCLHVEWLQEAVPVLEPRHTEEPSCPCRGTRASAGGQVEGPCAHCLATAPTLLPKGRWPHPAFLMLAAPSLLSLGPPHPSFTLVWGQKAGEAHRDLSRYHSAARPGLLQTEPVGGTCLSFCRTPHSSLWLGSTMRGPTVAFRGGVQLARCGANLAHSGHHLAPPLSREPGSLPEKKGLSPKLAGAPPKRPLLDSSETDPL